MLNIECSLETLDELTESFRFNDAVIRNMVMGRKQADTEVSPIMKLENESRERKERDEARAARQAAQQETEAKPSPEAASVNDEAESATPTSEAKEA
jgi:small subunit ribosomal protein S6